YLDCMYRMSTVCFSSTRFPYFFFFTDPAPTEIYTLSLHDALPISRGGDRAARHDQRTADRSARRSGAQRPARVSHARRRAAVGIDRKSTRLNSSHDQISYAVFCLKKKKDNK